jgi:hypothetical protein
VDNVVITEELVVKGLNISIYIYAPSVSDQPLNPTPLLSQTGKNGSSHNS